MRVCIVSRSFTNKGGQGIDRVSYNVARGLAKSPNTKVSIITGKKPVKSMFRGMLCDIGQAFRILKTRADIFYAASPYSGWIPVLLGKKTVVSIHDLIPFFYKEMHFLSRLYYKFCVKVCKRANHIITGSNFSKKKIIEMLGVPENKISMVWDAADHKVFYAKKPKKHAKFKIGFVGGLTKQKNPVSLLKAFLMLKENKDAELHIAGMGREMQRLRAIVKSKNIKNVFLHGYLEDKRLPDFYRGLDLFVYPSFHEGFGLPVLEAMACGCPVITSDRESLPEVAGNAGLLVNPAKPESIARAIKKVMKSAALRKKMRIRGIEQAKKFDWKITVEKYLQILKSAATSKK